MQEAADPPEAEVGQPRPPPPPPRPATEALGPTPTVEEVGSDSEPESQDGEYFASYGHDMLIHHQMLTDEPRTWCFAEALRRVAPGAVVLDVGCGSAVLSVFAARAGARRVFAVEASDMASTAAEIVRRNGVTDVVTVLHGKIEDVTLPEQVDVVVSEWMGTALLFESMWEPVLLARDRWLKPGGVMVPATSQLWAAALEATELWHDRVDRWRDVWGIDMAPVIERAVSTFFARPLFQNPVKARDVLTAGECVLAADMRTVTREELVAFSHLWVAPAQRQGQVHGAVLWFECGMLPDAATGTGTGTGADAVATVPAPAPPVRPELEDRVDALEQSIEALAQALSLKAPPEDEGRPAPAAPADVTADRPLVLSTAPSAPLTHWGHNLLVFDCPHVVEQGQELAMRFAMQQNPEYPRHYHLTLEMSPADRATAGPWYETKLFPLWR